MEYDLKPLLVTAAAVAAFEFCKGKANVLGMFAGRPSGQGGSVNSPDPTVEVPTEDGIAEAPVDDTRVFNPRTPDILIPRSPRTLASFA